MNKDPLFKQLLHNKVLANLLMVILIILGLIGLKKMPRELFPSIDFDRIIIRVADSGASPEDIEKNICEVIEESLKSISGIKKISSTAQENMGIIILELNDGADLDKIKDDVENQVQSITTLPQSAEKPIVFNPLIEKEVLKISISGDLDERSMKELAYELKDDIKKLEGVSTVSIAGIRDYEISIEVSREKLESLNLTIDDISNIIRTNNLTLSLGELRNEQEHYTLRIDSKRLYAEEFDDIVIKRSSEGVLYLRDIAVIKNSFDPNSEFIAKFNDETAVVLNVFKAVNEDSITISEIIHKYVEEKQQELSQVKLSVWADNSEMILGRIDLLSRNGIIGLFLVFLFLWLFLDFKLSFWITIGIPLSIAGSFAVMAVTGQTINMISLFALIMVLGIIVDDAIIIGESIYHEKLNHDDDYKAVSTGVKRILMPVSTAVITTIIAFTPLFFIDGIMGKFISAMPIPIIAALAISLFEALTILPTHLYKIQVKNKKPILLLKPFYAIKALFSSSMNFCIDKLYEPFLRKVLSWRYVVMLVGFVSLILLISLISFGHIKTESFPSSDTDFLIAEIEMPVGTTLEDMKVQYNKLFDSWKKTEKYYEEKLGNTKLTRALYSIVGGNVNQSSQSSSSSHLTSIYVSLIPTEDRNISYKKIIEKWTENLGEVKGANKVNIKGMIGGPKSPDIDFNIYSKNNTNIILARDAIIKELKKFESVYEISDSHRKGKRQLIFSLKENAKILNISELEIANAVKNAFYGKEAFRVLRDQDELKVMIRLDEKHRKDFNTLKDMKIMINDDFVPLSQLVEIKEDYGYSTIERKDTKRYINVTAQIKQGKNKGQILEEIEKQIPKIAEKYQVEISLGSEAEDNQRSLDSIVSGFVIAMLLIYLIIASVFKSYLQPLIILFTVPFGLMGAIVAHYIFGIALSIMSFFGMIALTGIVVNDSIVFTEAFNFFCKKDNFQDAMIKAGKRRFRAIILTTLTTFFGLFPMVLEKSLQAQVLIPMAISVAFGVLFATVSTLVLLPCILMIVSDIKLVLYYLFKGKNTCRNNLEYQLK